MRCWGRGRLDRRREPGAVEVGLEVEYIDRAENTTQNWAGTGQYRMETQGARVWKVGYLCVTRAA